MKSIVGLVEYTVTGGFLWILCLLFTTLMALDARGNASSALELWMEWLGQLQRAGAAAGTLPEFARDGMVIVIGGVLLIGIFATGLILDLIAPLAFALPEIRWAKRWLFENPREWFVSLVREHGEFLSGDYEALRAGGSWLRRSEWQVAPYWRLVFFLISYVLATARGGQQEEIFDRLKIWRVSRAISTSLLMLSLLLTTWVLFGATSQMTGSFLVTGMLVPWLVFAVSWFMTRTTFFRLVVSLQAAGYLGWKQHRAPESCPAV